MMMPLSGSLLALSLALAAAAPPETFTATASAKSGSTKVETAVTITISRHSSASERDALTRAIRQGGSSYALRTLLLTFADAGVIQVGERKMPIKFASERPTDTGRLITVATGNPILYLGAGLPDAKPRTGHDVAVAMLVVQTSGGGTGELVLAAKVGLDKDGSLLVQDYGEAVMALTAVNTVSK
jgi:hypothetical protein